MARIAGALLLPCLAGILARMAGAETLTAVILAVVASILGILVVVRSMRATAAWASVTVVLVIGTVPALVIGVLTEHHTLGPILDVPVAEANRHPVAAGFRLTDGAAPRAELRQVVTDVETWQGRRGAPGRTQSTFSIAPVLPPGWRPGQPVTAVAVAASRHELSRRVPDTAAWAAPGGLLRLLPDEMQTRAVHRALHQRGLDPAPHLVIGTWVADPGWARLESAGTALILLGVAILVLLVLAG